MRVSNGKPEIGTPITQFPGQPEAAPANGVIGYSPLLFLTRSFVSSVSWLSRFIVRR
jgi:hypothetical protein